VRERLLKVTSSVPKKVVFGFVYAKINYNVLYKVFNFKLFHFPGNCKVKFSQIFEPFSQLNYELKMVKNVLKMLHFVEFFYVQFPVLFA